MTKIEKRISKKMTKNQEIYSVTISQNDESKELPQIPPKHNVFIFCQSITIIFPTTSVNSKLIIPFSDDIILYICHLKEFADDNLTL